MRPNPLAIASILAVVALGACKGEPTPSAPPPAATSSAPPANPTATATAKPTATATPRCAVQDCATKKILDDGCVDDGKGGKLCASCVNPCPAP